MRSTFGVLALAAASEALIAQPKDAWFVVRITLSHDL